jgi:negative regulator of sigma E activity
MKWRYFLVAILVVGYAMLAVGAPPVAVAAGIALAAVLNLKQLASQKVQQPKKSNQTPATSATRMVNP